MRTAVELAHDRFDLAEVLEVGPIVPLVHCDVHRRPTRRRRQGDVIGRGHAHFDGEADPPVVGLDLMAHFLQCVRAVLGRDRVLHLVERRLARRAEDAVAAIAELDRVGPVAVGLPPPEETEDREAAPADDAILHRRLPPRLRRAVAQVRLREHPLGRRHPPELEVVVCGDRFVPRLDHLVHDDRRLGAVQIERRHAAKGHVGDDAERAETDASDRQQVRIICANVPSPAVGGDQRERIDEGREPAPLGARAVRRRRDGARDRLTIDVAEVREREPGVGKRIVHRRQRDPRFDGHEPGRRVEVEHPVQAVEHKAAPVGERDSRERVAGPDGLDAIAVQGRARHHIDHVVEESRMVDGGDVVCLVTCPVRPAVAHRSSFPRAFERQSDDA